MLAKSIENGKSHIFFVFIANNAILNV